MKALEPGTTGDRMAGRMLRSMRLRLVRRYGAAEVARVLGERRESLPRDKFTGPPERPSNVR